MCPLLQHSVDVRVKVRRRHEKRWKGERSAGERAVRGKHRAERSQKMKPSH